MLRFGICTEERYLRLGPDRRGSCPQVSYRLLDVGENPRPEQVRAFEDISFLLLTSNGTTRTTFAGRFRDVDEAVLGWMHRLFEPSAGIDIQDRAASHALTSCEWAERVFEIFPNARFEASDILLNLVEISRGCEAYILEPGGCPLQFVKPPFVVSLQAEPRRYPVNRLIARRARRRLDGLLRGASDGGWTEAAARQGWRVRRIPYVHPRARALAAANPNFHLRVRSVFDVPPAGCDVLRTMNIFNSSYFTRDQLAAGAEAAFQSLRRNGIWIVGRTLEEDFSNHVSLLQRGERSWQVLDRIGRGSEMESLALGMAL